MLRILVTGANNEEGRKELREFEKFLNREFRILYKSRVKCIKICYYKGKCARIKKTTDSLFNNSNILQDSTYAQQQQQSNLINQANAFQGVNLIYAVDTN
ncbi:hypothetical protein ST12_11355 [Clostridium botulinum]|uniref:RebB family R body protein n=1 Tax=Clostridium botulinum TaxID=1491 RepID=UPI000174E547|nr:RebB family R body protein [Clostridium botulinum]ACD51393.1 hypothetical protein CLH_2413 [Clostridium botulinum E3 str. Alaska E43]AJF30264.1 hypothetical protein ST13_11355 [Clostridium botulinum]AJF33327.1 hypothetical protein ST12_11355 [Clostridium botulinum]MBY6788530.1 RebB family R body protein [Clostridium botulinum]MBY6816186.1 RebB family R body protein [Clostridium botulinum]